MLISIIVKVSKLCNLRCVYCYETPELASRERMSLENVQTLFTNIRRFIEAYGQNEKRNLIEFIWHGGEPFANPISYWNKILSLQQESLSGLHETTFTNTVQSNLTLLRKEHLELLRYFRLGCSFDVINDFRVDIAGKATASKVKRKLEWLRSEGFQPGGIAVISRLNVEYPEQIAKFFLSRGMSFRALNIYQAKDMLPQIREAAVPFEKNLEFYARLYDLPMVQDAMQKKISIDPVTTARYMWQLYRNGSASPFSEEQCYQKEWALMVNTNGDVFSPGDAYNPQFRYGNIFKEDLQQVIFNSEGRQRRIQKSRERMEQVCKNCFLFRQGCNGTFVSHATPEEFRDFQRMNGCYHKFIAEKIGREQAQASTTAPKHDQKIEDVLYLNITYRCNSRCLFCAADVAYKTTPRQLSLKQIQDLIGDRKYLQIQLSGGEPTIHPEILDIIQYCRLHSENVVLLTHGRAFERLDFVENVVKAGANFMIIPLYGPDAATHDHVSKVKGSFDQTVAGLKNIEGLRKRYDVQVELKFLLSRFTAPLNHRVYRFAKDHFASAFDQISICPLIYSQSTMDYKEEFLAPFDEMKEHLFSLIDLVAADQRYRIRTNEFPPCFFPQELRSRTHPMLQKPLVRHRRFYGDDQSNEQVPMDENVVRFRTTLKGNLLVKSCQKCVHQEYCSERETPYFSPAYLQEFGESEFHPVSQEFRRDEEMLSWAK